MAGRSGVRDTLYKFLYNPPVAGLNQVFTSFPKRINFQVNSEAGQLSRSAVVIFIQSETETRIAIGGNVLITALFYKFINTRYSVNRKMRCKTLIHL